MEKKSEEIRHLNLLAGPVPRGDREKPHGRPKPYGYGRERTQPGQDGWSKRRRLGETDTWGTRTCLTAGIKRIARGDVGTLEQGGISEPLEDRFKELE